MNILTGIGDSNEIIQYHMFSDPAVNTFSAEEAEKWKKGTWIQYLGSKQVKMQQINDILKTHLTPSEHIDYLNIDIEGLDLSVLKTFDFDTYKPSVISIEDHGAELHNIGQSEIYKLLSSEGYTLHSALKFSFVYITKTQS